MDVKRGTKRKRPASNEKKQKLTKKHTKTVTPKEKPKWTNKNRVLVFGSRGIKYKHRHLMNDLRNMMPHAKPDIKMDKRQRLFVINEICEMKNCNKALYFEARKKKDLYMWASNVPQGPSASFLVQNMHTMDELKMTGNSLKGSRPLVSFDKVFDETPHMQVLKELFTQIFSTPYMHPKSQPFFDHVLQFSICDERIWFRNYQILEENGELVEIGPRFILNPIKIFQSSFGGTTLWQNPQYITPNEVRRSIKLSRSVKYRNKMQSQKELEHKKETTKESYPTDITDDIFV